MKSTSVIAPLFFGGRICTPLETRQFEVLTVPEDSCGTEQLMSSQGQSVSPSATQTIMGYSNREPCEAKLRWRNKEVIVSDRSVTEMMRTIEL